MYVPLAHVYMFTAININMLSGGFEANHFTSVINTNVVVGWFHSTLVVMNVYVLVDCY